MMWARSASIRVKSSCRWSAEGYQKVVRVFSSGRLPETEDVPLEDITTSKPTTTNNSSSTDTSSMFGIAPRKLRNVEDDEDFVSAYPPLPNSPSSTMDSVPQQNYFSQAWAAQKHRVLGRSPGRIEDQLTQPGSPPSGALHGWSHSRVWLTAPDFQVANEGTFTFVSYKVLASANVSRHRGHLYGHVPNQVLEWRNRKRKLLSELELCSPDIICLQEVDRFTDLKTDLAAKGYTGIYKVRTGASPDGCAIFWRHERFQLLHEESFEFCETGMRDNIAQFCVLQTVLPGSSSAVDSPDSRSYDVKRRSVIVGNINVLFNPRRGDIKLGQCRVFLEQASNLMNSWPDSPLVIGGCFNCTPESPIYKYLATSELDVSGLDRRYISGQQPAPNSTTPKSGVETKKQGSVSLRESLAALNTDDSDRSLSERLKTSLTARYSTEQDRQVEGFAGAAKQIVKADSEAEVANNQASTMCNEEKQHEVRKEDSGLNKFVSRTIEILENSINTEQSVDAKRKEESVLPEAGVESEKSVLDNQSSGDSVDIKGNQSGKPKSSWDLDELKVATGSPECMVLRHKLSLKSVYPEIQGREDTRDAKGEPLLTMYHREFRGTVDYIWRSDGLKTTKVLDTVPLKAILVTPGLPSAVHGSDHVPIACELAFTPS